MISLDKAFDDVRPGRTGDGCDCRDVRIRIQKVRSPSSSLSPSFSSPRPSPPHGMATAKIKSVSSRVANAFTHPTIVTTVQKNNRISPATSAGSSPTLAKTPKTPADEGIDFFESSIRHGETPIRVYELPLEPDGGPSKSREVCPTKSIYSSATLTNLFSTFVSLLRMSRISSVFL